MDRRHIMVSAGCAAGLLSLGAFAGLTEEQARPGQVPVALTAELAGLADPRLAGYAQERDQLKLLERLMKKGVITAQYRVDPERVAALAQRETAVIRAGFYYTPTELDLYSLAILLAGSIPEVP